MGNLIINQKLNLKLIPEILQDDFEKQILEAYFLGGWHDLHNLSFHVDNFAIYSASYYETGDAFDFIDDDSRFDSNIILIKSHFNDVMEDVHEVLNHRNMFHAWNDFGNDFNYEYEGCTNMPITKVW